MIKDTVCVSIAICPSEMQKAQLGVRRCDGGGVIKKR